MDLYPIVWEGNNLRIQAFGTENRCHIKEELNNLPEKERKKLDALWYSFNQSRGAMANLRKVKKLEIPCDKCFEFKPTGQIRVSFTYIPKMSYNICLLDVFRKKKNKWPKYKIKTTVERCKLVRKKITIKGG